jgi:1-deoxyxylulose-5-phosphate synthase
MYYRQLGRSGVKVSVVGLGTNRVGRTIDLEGTKAIVARALDLGINFIDTADVYGAHTGDSEELLGRALAGQWDRVVLGTKVGNPAGQGPNEKGGSRYHIANSVEGSLRRLKTDHIDLYYIHSWDPDTPLEETLRALDDLVSAGKVRYIGASNFSAWQLAHANDLAALHNWNAFVVVQEHYHMLHRQVEREMLPYCRYANVGLIPFFPLAGGFLTGKYRRGEPVSPTRTGYVQPYLNEKNLAILERLDAFVKPRGHTLAELAVAWLLADSHIPSVIAGATNPEQVAENAKAADWQLTMEEVAEVRKILEG